MRPYQILGYALLLLCPPLKAPAAPPVPDPRPNRAGLPPTPLAVSPVDFFRQLLKATPAERADILAKRPSAKRAYLEEKLREYGNLSLQEMEHRLQLLETRWLIVPLMGLPQTEREPRLQQIAPAQRKWIEMRLRLWDQLDSSQQKEILENEMALDYFIRAGLQPPLPPGANQKNPQPMQKTLVEESQDKPFKYILKFFELSEKEKNKTLAALSVKDREHLDKILPEFDKLDREQRQFCLGAFRRFTEMNSDERARFKKSAERWRAMSEPERNAWRQLISTAPPLPPGALHPPVPPGLWQASNSPGDSSFPSKTGSRPF